METVSAISGVGEMLGAVLGIMLVSGLILLIVKPKSITTYVVTIGVVCIVIGFNGVITSSSSVLFTITEVVLGFLVTYFGLKKNFEFRWRDNNDMHNSR